jgi:hypothetical protein
MRVDLFFVVVDLRVRFRRWWLPFAYLHGRGLLLRRTRLSHSERRVSVCAIALVRLLSSRLYISQRRPDKFAIHNASSKLIKKRKLPNPEFTSIQCNKNSKAQDAAFRGEMRTDPLRLNNFRDWAHATRLREKRQSSNALTFCQA